MIYALAHAFKCPDKLSGAKNRVICCQWRFVDYSAKVFACRSCYRNVLLLNGVNKTQIPADFSFLECVEMPTRACTSPHLFYRGLPLSRGWLYTFQPPFLLRRRHKTLENQGRRCSTRLEVWQRCPCYLFSKGMTITRRGVLFGMQR